MLTNIINNQTFTGYDARRLRALCFSHKVGGVTNELSEIGQKVGFDVFVASGKSLCKPQNIISFSPLANCNPWAQDIAVVTPQNRVTAAICNHDLASLMTKKFFGLDNRAKIGITPPAGGNLFFVDAGNNNTVLLAGENTAKINDIEKLKDFYGVKEIHFIPQMDFHLDLFIRPLDKKRVLVCDDDLTMDVLTRGKEKIKNYITKNRKGIFKQIKLNRLENNLNEKISAFEKAQFENPFKNVSTNKVCEVLENLGFTTIRVPGRYYSVKQLICDDISLFHEVNYMNSIVHKSKEGKLYYITNKSLIDENLKLTPDLIEDLDFSFEKEFIKSLSGLISDKNIYFMRGKNDFIPKKLLQSRGGIHCFASEVPEKI